MITEEMWVKLKQIKNFLEIFKEVTVIMLGSFYPTLSMTIPLYNILIDHVEDVIGNEDDQEIDENIEENNSENEVEWNQIIKEAAKKSRTKLVEYYNKTNNTYLISTILDPRLKFQYYKDQKWEDSLTNNIYQK